MLNKQLAIIRRDFIQRFSSRSELLFFLILPIIFTTILSGALGGGSDDNRVELAIVMEDQSAAATSLLAELDSSSTVQATVESREEALSRFENGDVGGAVIIPAGYGAALAGFAPQGDQATPSLYLDPANTAGQVIEQAVAEALGVVGNPAAVARTATLAAAATEPFASDIERDEFFQQAMTNASDALDEQPGQVRRLLAGAVSEDEYDPAAQASAGQMITWVLIPLLGIASLFTFERMTGTLRRLLVTPTRKSTYLLGTLSAQLIMGLIQIGLLVGFGVFVLGVDYGSSPLGLIILLVAFALSGVALGTLMGTFTRTDSQASNLAIMLGMGMALLGGCWWPMELFPETVQTAVKVLPTTWAMQGLTNLIMRNQGVEGVLLESGVLVAFAVVFFVIGVRRFQFE